MKSQIGLIGLGVMGENLALNIEEKGFPIAVYNRTTEKTRRFVERLDPEIDVKGTYSIEEFLEELEKPRKIILMVTAGSAVDDNIASLKSKLSRGDVVVDGGNSFFRDTDRRSKDLAEIGVRYLGVGVSGGEEGARVGPCLMAGGSEDAYRELEPILTKVAAQTSDGACCAYLGSGSAGHYVKMVHNGIEYAVMQLIAEVYDSQYTGLGLPVDTIRKNFSRWNDGELSSYLMEITVTVLGKKDEITGRSLVEVILDKAGQKGTGKWTSQSALDLGVPTPSIDAAVASRNLSSRLEERLKAAKVLKQVRSKASEDNIVESLGDALFSSVIVSYSQGLSLLRAASQEYGYSTEIKEVARIWKGGCIIRAKLLDMIYSAYKNPLLENLIFDERIAKVLGDREDQWRRAITFFKNRGIPLAVLNASLDYYDAYRRERLPANLIQAQRDYFGAHKYQRVDMEGTFHTNWKS